jgi:hypothetical protein
MGEPEWLARQTQLLERLGEHLREAKAAADPALRRSALEAATSVHREIGELMREGAGYLAGLAAPRLRPRGSRLPQSETVH